MSIKVTLTSLPGYSSLTKGSTYSITVKAKAYAYNASAASAAVRYTVPIPQLSTPTLSISETTISWTIVTNATSYEIYVDDNLYETVDNSKSSYDLSTSSKWSSLSIGTHIVKVRAKASGYTDSAFSNTVTVSTSTGTEILKAGTYMWQDIPNAGTVVTTDAPLVQNLEFISYEEKCTSISVYRDYAEVSDVSIEYDPAGIAYDLETSSWRSPELQTIVLETDQFVSAEFYQWAIVEENLIKQD